MFYKLLCAVILVVPLYANSAQKEDQKETIKQYKEALELYKQKKYQKAYNLFNKLFENNLDDVNINFYLGRSAYELKKYYEAVVAFDRVLFSQPDSTRTKLEIAKAYYMSRKFPTAKKYFEESLKDPKLPKNIKDSINKYLVIIDDNTQKSFLNGVILIGANYDSNVNNRSDYDLYNIPNLPNPATNTVDGVNDWAHQEIFILNHKYVKNDKTTFKNDFMYFTKTMNHHTVSSKDIDMISYTPTISHTYKNGLAMDYSIFADALWLDDISNLRSYGFMPKFTYTINKNMITNGYIKYQKKRNQVQTSKINDSTYIEINNGWQFISKSGIPYGVSLTFSREQQNNEQANNTIDKDEYTLKTNSTYMLGKKISLAPSLSYKIAKYDHNDFLYKKRRSDDEYKAALIATYIYSPKLLFQVGGDYTKYKSNIHANEYSKHTFTFNLIRPF